MMGSELGAKCWRKPWTAAVRPRQLWQTNLTRPELPPVGMRIAGLELSIGGLDVELDGGLNAGLNAELGSRLNPSVAPIVCICASGSGIF